MSVVLASAHAAARQSAAHAAARAVSLARANAGAMSIAVYATTLGDTSAPALLTWDAGTGAAELDEVTGIISVVGPFTAQVAATGTPAWARVAVGGAEYLDVTVTDAAGAGPLKIDLGEATQLHAGAFCVLTRLDLPA